MSCVGNARLAAAASGADAAALAHADACVRCAIVLDEQRAMRAVGSRVPAPALGGARRAALLAEIAAASDQLAPRRAAPVAGRWTVGPREVLVATACVLAAAAVIVWLVRAPERATESASADHPVRALDLATDHPVRALDLATDHPVRALDLAADRSAAPTGPTLAVVSVPVPVPVPVPPPVGLGSTGPSVAWGPTDAAPAARAIAPVAREVVAETRELVRGLVARGRTIGAYPVFAATAAKHAVAPAADEWSAAPSVAITPVPEQSAPAPAASEQSAPPAPQPLDPSAFDPRFASAAAFRAGWESLREGHDAEAIASFDRATDPAVVEDATFWAAIAAARAGDTPAATRRLHAFLARFPTSPHAPAARAALARVER